MNPRLKWTPEIDAEIKSLLGLKKSMRQVADFLSWKYGVPVTRNMVIGRNYRTNPRPRRPRLDLFGRSLEELELRDCAYPFGDQAPYRFCGKRAQSGSTYCSEHHAKCFRPKEESEKPKAETAFKAGKPRHLMVAA